MYWELAYYQLGFLASLMQVSKKPLAFGEALARGRILF
jgi:hypothetical protein